MKKHLLILLTLVAFSSVYAQDQNSAIVLELFTSQGCSSCPPADALLDDIREKYENDNVYVLSYHVDYWNRLGWRDPFSTEAYSDYQRDYAVKFRSRSIYTPQLVVNGSEHFTGSNQYKADDALRRYAKAPTTNNISISDVNQKGNTVSFSYTTKGDEFSTVTLALVVAERITKVSRGENRNRTLKNTNIVANRVVKNEETGEVSIAIPDWVGDTDQLAVIAYTQDGGLRTTGAVRIEI